MRTIFIRNAAQNKYNARKTSIDGITFDSQREASRYEELKLMKLAGEIQELQLQPEFLLQEAFTDNKGKRRKAIIYKADFQYIEDGTVVVEDVKGVQTDVFKLKMKLFLKQYPGIDFRIIK